VGRRGFSQIEGHRVRRGGERGKALLPAPGLEVAPVGAVGAQGGIALGGAQVLAGLAGEALPFGRVGRQAGGRGAAGAKRMGCTL
jgi:hypothetical protein